MKEPIMAVPPSPSLLAPLTLTLFGPMQVQAMGKPLPRLRSRKSLWLLALLALRPSRSVEREWLAGTLWPDADPEQGLANLRTALSELRQALGEEACRLQSPNRHALCLELADADVDVLAFDTAIISRKPEDLARAVSLYTGPLLEGCAEEWVGQERTAREQDCLLALLTLADAALAAGDHETAAGFYRRAASLDPWRDAAHRGLMEALALGGDTNAALHVYREFVSILRDDPKAMPDEQTRALYDRLRGLARRQAAPPSLPPPVPAPQVSGYLPHPLTELIGREDERQEVAAGLRRSRLVTLTGPGGIGKTRLALSVASEVAPEYADGVWLVALEALSERALVERQIASVLGVKEETNLPLRESLTCFLHGKQLLLVLDNCEHLLEDSAQAAAQILRHCAGLRILATSREALGITGETVWAVPALAVPKSEHLPTGRVSLARVLSGYDSVRLFVERAQAVQTSFSLTGDNARTVAEICARLGGLPLAIELAAARVKAMTVGQIAARLDDHLTLLTGGNRVATSRQQTLRATLDWSYALLSEAEQLLFCRLSVFSGGWTLEAAEKVCRGEDLSEQQILDLLISLADKSLLMFECRKEATGRYRLLEIVQQYAAARMGPGTERDAAKSRHREYFVSLAEEAEAELIGTEQQSWLERLETEHDNFRSALSWCEREPDGAHYGLRLAGALVIFWNVRGHLSEARQNFQRALERLDAQDATTERAKALDGAGLLAYCQGDFDSALRLHQEGLTIFQTLGDKKGMALALKHLGSVDSIQGNLSLSKKRVEESLNLFRELGDLNGIALALIDLGGIIREQGNYAAARSFIEEGLSIRRKLGNKNNIALALLNLGNVARLQGDYITSQVLIEESLSLFRETGSRRYMASALSFLGSAWASQGDHMSAQALFEESLSIRRDLGDKQGVAWALNNLGIVAYEQGRSQAAKILFEESLSLFQEIKSRGGTAWALIHLSDVLRSQNEHEAGREATDQSLRIFLESGDREGVAAGLRAQASVMQGCSKHEEAALLWGAAEALRRHIGAPLPPFAQQEHDRLVEQTRSVLDGNAFTVAWNQGRALTWDQAAAYALDKTSLREAVAGKHLIPGNGQ